MALDLYSPCPCGSGKKFKWCCQPIHQQISKAFEQDANGQHEAALKTMDDVAAEHPGNPEVWGRKAQLLYQMDKADDAEAALQKAFAINPNYPFGHLLRGLFRQHEGEIPGALLLFRRAADLYDNGANDVLAQVYSLIADCELKLNRPVAAHAAMKISLRVLRTENTERGLESLFGEQSRLPASARKTYAFQSPPGNLAPERKASWDRALSSAATGKLSDAARSLEELAGEEPDNAAENC